ncbi:IS3 family transposase [Lysinibacillus sphaericus]|uniref:IS3 family transposase n=1 Tax=Lysinibacillus sphaericus TaxID=1421 RepID=UPI0009B80B7A|nr:IS3 family transposase [Lysinibacillus sphaericus]QTB15486.1 IS3 family transposase [Lysinibacillus sphaericus]QTB20769.1 IS3 family transposase [Lysinibacillus sphaericus]
MKNGVKMSQNLSIEKRGELEQAINDNTHFYNHYRYQKRLKGLSPLEFRAQAA